MDQILDQLHTSGRLVFPKNAEEIWNGWIQVLHSIASAADKSEWRQSTFFLHIGMLKKQERNSNGLQFDGNANKNIIQVLIN